MMKRRYRLLIPAVAPLLLKSGYLLEAWRHSRSTVGTGVSSCWREF